jgi:hypothetical protein
MILLEGKKTIRNSQFGRWNTIHAAEFTKMLLIIGQIESSSKRELMGTSTNLLRRFVELQ